jgi:multisubunit Na+/H+ antiporter MnhG subunit
MESDFDDTPDRRDETRARAALSALDADRQNLADRIRTPAWYYPLLGVATAMIIGSPGAGVPAQFILVAFGCLGITLLATAYQRHTGLTITRMAGPRSRTTAILLGVFIVLLLPVSFSLTATGHAVWVWLPAAAAFAAMWIGGVIYDRAYDRELRRGR